MIMGTRPSLGDTGQCTGEAVGVSAAPRRIMIVGLPNTGKSQIHNLLTGKYSVVANYPRTTVEIVKTRCIINGQPFEVYDTPGLHSLFVHSEEELVVRETLFREPPDLLIQCIDANQVKQSLALLADLAELKLPMVVVLNAVDEVQRRGATVDSGALSSILGVPVVEIRNLQDHGADRLRPAVDSAAICAPSVDFGGPIETAVSRLERELPESLGFRKKIAQLLLEGDPFVGRWLRARTGGAADLLAREAEVARRLLGGGVSRIVAQRRNRWVDGVCERVVKTEPPRERPVLQRIAGLCRRPSTGMLVLAGVVAAVYLSLVYVAGSLEQGLNAVIADPLTGYLSSRIGLAWVRDLLVGDFGLLTLGLFNAVFTVLPILTVFFLLFGLLEDVGYIPNLSVWTNCLFRKIGITGKSIMPLVSGLSCKTMATLLTRGLQSRREKFITVYLVAFAIPCSAQFGLNMTILGRVGITAFLIAFGTLALMEILAGVVLNRVLKADAATGFIQELPPLRIPDFHAILWKTRYRLTVFLKEALPIFILASLLLFLIDRTGVLDLIQRVLRPLVVVWLGLPASTIQALLVVLVRREAAGGMLLKMADAGALTPVQGIVAVVLTTAFLPCFVNIMAICREMGLKAGLAMFVSINVSSIILAGILRMALERVM